MSFLNIISRENKICLIYSVICGLASFIFTDFGPNFTIYDEFCIKKRKFFIKKIERSEKGLVEIEWDKKRNPYIKDYVIFKDVEGMTEINYNKENKKVFKIEPKSDIEFYIGNTLNYSEYKSGGYIEETVTPKKVSYESSIKKWEEPFINELDYVNHRKKFIFLVFKALMEFYELKQRLPFSHDENDYKEIKSITKNIIDNLNYNNLKSFKRGELFLMKILLKAYAFHILQKFYA